MLTNEQRAITEDKVRRLLAEAEAHYGVKYPGRLEIEYYGNKRSLGCFKAVGMRIMFNKVFAAQDWYDFINDTVPHEVAHCVVHMISLRTKERYKPHGDLWKRVMAFFGVYNAKAVAKNHKYDSSVLPIKRQKRYEYICNCRTHYLSATKHNRRQRGEVKYTCIYCGEVIELKKD